jgi:branched-chain amino acid transport system permease protein
MSEALLSLRGISKRFGGVPVLSNVSLDLSSGRIHALIGPNGAGKTTLLNVMSGYLSQDSGTIRFRHQSIDGWAASRRVQHSLARTFQIVQLFGHMTVLENVLCGFHLQVAQSMLTPMLRPGVFTREEQRLREQAAELVKLVGLEAYAGEEAGLLPFGLQRRLELARALATRPALLLLDEPCAGLSGPESHVLGESLQQLARGGMGVLVVEHNMPFVLGIAEHVVVLDAGEVIAEGRPEQVRSDPRVVEAYLGEIEHVPA